MISKQFNKNSTKLVEKYKFYSSLTQRTEYPFFFSKID